ncbi:hypothetical protein LTR56_022008 [Elasticomyces elasticus]|nr:hypothetical protein LTR56_022008 [Elasticomyces elasticus]KAK3635024.1 hypothetical protein LTR22_019380 [Elasticomyces elasticus]KAK4915795.1 hypothetical protein LTR49_016164 [Elasticomyces elasticus]KAK5749457.1 hypothetical protein LTS12_020506 [Elasticomyces elasticus]
MADLHDLLDLPATTANDAQTSSYLTRLTTLSLPDLSTTEPASLLQAAHSHLRNLQALSKRSHKAVIASASHLAELSNILPGLTTQAQTLRDHIPTLENAATTFASKYARNTTETPVLDRRKRALLLTRNLDRVSDVLDLPSLLSSTVAAAGQTPNTNTNSGTAATTTNYASALDLHSHIKRLHTLYPHSALIHHISQSAEQEIEHLTAILITSLQSPGLKLAAAIRTVGWLRRVAPELTDHAPPSLRPANDDGALGTLFLLSRLRNLNNNLKALDPLRELADQETVRRKRLQTTNGVSKAKQGAVQQPGSGSGSGALTAGQSSERYLKRFLEIFREQSFAIVSMYRSVFPGGVPTPERSEVEVASLEGDGDDDDALLPLPSPLSTFTLHLVDILTATLREYLPNIADKSSRESLLTQVLYCAGSLGRLGGDFGLMIAGLGEELAAGDADDGDGDGDGEGRGVGKDRDVDGDGDVEWVQVMKKHRIQASRLEVLARGVGSGGPGVRKGSEGVVSPGGGG